MFGLIKDIAGFAGIVIGSVLGIPIAIIAKTLDITVESAKEAVDAGCTTYDEIREYLK